MSIPQRWLDQADAAIRNAPANLTLGGWDAEHVSPLDRDQVATALAFLACGPVKVLRRVPSRWAPSSYGLKHRAERWGRDVGMAPYVSNGSMIAAALHANVPMSQYDRVSPNCWLAVRVTTLAA